MTRLHDGVRDPIDRLRTVEPFGALWVWVGVERLHFDGTPNLVRSVLRAVVFDGSDEHCPDCGGWVLPAGLADAITAHIRTLPDASMELLTGDERSVAS